MIRLEWLFFMQVIMGVLMIILLQKLTQMKKQVDEIIREVTSYISYITEAEQEVQTEEKKNRRVVIKGKEEEQNRLIQAVLGEYFP